MSSLDDIANIIQSGYVSTSGCEKKNVKIENLTDIGSGSYMYDAYIFFSTHQEAQSNVFYSSVENSTVFNDTLKNAIEMANPTFTVTSLVDTNSEKFSRSFNKGQSNPRFDRILPTIEDSSFQIQLDNPDYIEVADVSCVKATSSVTTSFTINTNLVNEKLLWRIKLTNQDLSNESNFTDFLSTIHSEQKQHYISAPHNGSILVSNKTIEKAYSTTTTTSALVSFDPNVTHYIYIMVYFESVPHFKAVYAKIISNGS